jgi:hypothetical protein
LSRWRKHFSLLFNVNGIRELRQTEMHATEPLVPELVEMPIEKLKGCKSPGVDQVQENRLRQGVEKYALRFINLLILFGIKRNCLRSGKSRSF